VGGELLCNGGEGRSISSRQKEEAPNSRTFCFGVGERNGEQGDAKYSNPYDKEDRT